MKRFRVIPVFLSLLILASCSLNKKGSSGRSSTTGWIYNDPEFGGFEVKEDYKRTTGPGLVFIQGGSFTMGKTEQDVMYEWNNTPRRVTVASFYMDETEVRNVDWLEYLYWLQRVYPDNPEKYSEALPDTLVWRSELAYNEPFLENYLRHPAYSQYPVVGVSWLQADKYCAWRTDRVNEVLLIENKILAIDLEQKSQNIFTTDAYLSGQYVGIEGESPLASSSGEGTRRVNKSDGILLPKYRLPTEAEWEYAALGLLSISRGENVAGNRIYPWQGKHLRYGARKNRGRMRANFVRGRGDMMGIAGALNDGYSITAPVNSFEPNDYGLYCMAGNVSEWVKDVYRPLSFYDFEEFQPARGIIYRNPKRDADGKLIRNKYGETVYDTVANYENYRDGDYQTQIDDAEDWNTDENKNKKTANMYSSRISDNTRVYKGGSWKDRAYWLSPGTRRYLKEDKSTNDLGFRCAMTHVGDPVISGK